MLSSILSCWYIRSIQQSHWPSDSSQYVYNYSSDGAFSIVLCLFWRTWLYLKVLGNFAETNKNINCRKNGSMAKSALFLSFNATTCNNIKVAAMSMVCKNLFKCFVRNDVYFELTSMHTSFAKILCCSVFVLLVGLECFHF